MKYLLLYLLQEFRAVVICASLGRWELRSCKLQETNHVFGHGKPFSYILGRFSEGIEDSKRLGGQPCRNVLSFTRMSSFAILTMAGHRQMYWEYYIGE